MLLLEAIALIEQNIAQNLRHRDYKRVCDLSDKYEMLITGEDMTPLIKQFVRREDETAFNQRLAITQAITPAVSNSIMGPFNKVTRNRKITKRLEIKGASQKKSVEDMIMGFYGDEADNKGLDYWLQTRFIDLSFMDPNAFLVIEFKNFDYRYEKPKPYPFEVSCKEAINFFYDNNILRWLLVKNDITYDVYNGGEKKTTKKGGKFTLYDEDFTIVYTQVDKTYKPLDGENVIELGKQKEFYIQQIFTPKLGFCPAMRIGYVCDKKTRSRTYVNPFHASLPYFMKSIKTVSEMDLTMALHAFPQKLQYVNPCLGTKNNKCIGGKDAQGTVCTVCNGLGFAVHSSAQDVLYYAMNKEMDKTNMMDLNNMLVYKGPDIGIAKFQAEFIDNLEIKAHRTIFNSDIYVNPNNSVAKTATEKNLEMESIYDALAPYAQRLSTIWVFSVYTFAALADANPDEATIQHSFPSDLKMETMGTLLEKVKLANDSKAPAFVIQGVNNDIANLMYSDDETGLARYKTQTLFYPFAGKTQDEVLNLLNGSLIREFDKVLYAYYNRIFNEIEIDKGIEFYQLTPQKQWEEIKTRVETIIKEIQDESAGTLENKMRTLLNNGNNTGTTATPPDPNTANP